MDPGFAINGNTGKPLVFGKIVECPGNLESGGRSPVGNLPFQGELEW